MEVRSWLCFVIAYLFWLVAGALDVRAAQGCDLDSYQDRLLCRIRDGKQKGRLTATEEKRIMELYTLATAKDKRHRRGGLDFWERRTRWYLLNQLDRTLDDELDDSVGDGDTSQASMRLSDLNDGIEQGSRSGQFTAADCESLKTFLLAIERKRCLFALEGLSTHEHDLLDEDLDHLERDFYQRLTNSERNMRVGLVDNRLYPIRVKIDRGAADGTLTRKEAEQLNRDYARLRDLEDRWSTSNGYVTGWEHDTLGRLADLLDLSVDIKTANSQGKTPVAARAANRGQFQNQAPAPYLWYPSRHGGYYDASGQINGLIFANELCRYDGVMADGTPAPKSSDVRANFAGHLDPIDGEHSHF